MVWEHVIKRFISMNESIEGSLAGVPDNSAIDEDV
jgi:hypothetical protein